MSATYELERRAAERAELEHLLVRLQEAHVDGWKLFDPARRKWNELYSYFRVSSKDIAKTCEALCTAGAGTFIGKHKDCATELQKLIVILQMETDSKNKKKIVQKTATNWALLTTLLKAYEQDIKIALNDKNEAVAYIETLRRQMKTYASYWSELFKNVPTVT